MDIIDHVCLFDSVILAIGGQDETSILSGVEMYDPQLNAWIPMAPLPQPLRCMASVSYRLVVLVTLYITSPAITKVILCNVQ